MRACLACFPGEIQQFSSLRPCTSMSREVSRAKLDWKSKTLFNMVDLVLIVV